jgi:hypothetical protein
VTAAATERRTSGGRLLAAGIAIGAGMVLVGAPARGTRQGVPIAAERGEPAPLLDRSALTMWCRQALDRGAVAEPVGPSWSCVGRPGGIWRVVPLRETEACAWHGWPSRIRGSTEAGVACAEGP